MVHVRVLSAARVRSAANALRVQLPERYRRARDPLVLLVPRGRIHHQRSRSREPPAYAHVSRAAPGDARPQNAQVRTLQPRPTGT